MNYLPVVQVFVRTPGWSKFNRRQQPMRYSLQIGWGKADQMGEEIRQTLVRVVRSCGPLWGFETLKYRLNLF